LSKQRKKNGEYKHTAQYLEKLIIFQFHSKDGKTPGPCVSETERHIRNFSARKIQKLLIKCPNAADESGFWAGILLAHVFTRKSTENGCKNNRDYDKKNNAAKKSIKTGKYFSFLGLQSRYPLHARQDHRSIQERVYPVQFLK